MSHKKEEGYTSLLDDNEEEQVEEYKQKVKNNPILKKHKIGIIDNNEEVAVKKSFLKFMKFMLVFLGIIIIASIGIFAYLINEDKLKSTVACGNVQNECQPCQVCGNVSLVCETQTCNCATSYNLTCNYPSNLTINLVNSS